MICRQHLHELSLVSPAWTLLAHKTSGDCDVRRRRTLNPQTTQSNVFVCEKSCLIIKMNCCVMRISPAKDHAFPYIPLTYW